MLSVAPLNVEVSLPHEAIGASYDIPVPGPKLGSTHEIVVGPDGNFWFTQQSQDRVGRMTYDGQFTFFPTGVKSGPHGIHFDAQGRLWITRQDANTITQMDLHGNIIANHTIPSPNASPHGLAIARDGKVWFTGREGNLVGYYDPATNAFKLYDLPDRNRNETPETGHDHSMSPDPKMSGNFPIYIAEAPDGSMYFTDLLTSRVGRITPDGALTEYLLPSKFGPADNARPIAVYVRSDGIAVVTEEAGHAYAYILPSGIVEELPLSPPEAKSAGLAYDRMGTLWIQYNTPDMIGRVNPDGSITAFPIPTVGAVQHRVILGPDGNLWFTELAADKIGRMVTGHASGPKLDAVAGQSFASTARGLSYNAAFQQGQNTYRAHYRLRIAGKPTQSDRQSALFDFTRNLQSRTNHLPRSASKPAFGLQLPTVSGPGIRTQFHARGRQMTFVQRERIGQAVYISRYQMRIGHAHGPTSPVTNLSSATAHYLEAIKVLSEQV